MKRQKTKPLFILDTYNLSFHVCILMYCSYSKSSNKGRLLAHQKKAEAHQGSYFISPHFTKASPIFPFCHASFRHSTNDSISSCLTCVCKQLLNIMQVLTRKMGVIKAKVSDCNSIIPKISCTCQVIERVKGFTCTI